jgi:hypothetical protein
MSKHKLVVFAVIIVLTILLLPIFEDKIELPTFLRREEAASLTEMLQQPPTNIYGSSINVFVYEDENGEPDRVVITGHADSTTCEQASGAVMGQMLVKKPNGSDFLLAGAGSMVAQKADETLLDNLAVKEYMSLLTLKKIYEMMGNSSENSELNNKLDNLRNDENVRILESSLLEREALNNLIRELEKISHNSGLVQLHRLPANLFNQVSARLNDAVGKDSAGIVEVSDLLPKHVNEAGVIVPMLNTRTGEPIILNVSVNEFSKEGFQQAMIEHRSQVETAILGNARSRLKFANEQFEEMNEQNIQCKRYSESQLQEITHPDQRCTRDGCFHDPNAISITRRQYCSSNVPHWLGTFEKWRREAEEIIKKVENNQSGSKDAIDRITHAALVDSMMRNWALPVGDTQAAFDSWRQNRRSVVWKLIMNEIDKQNIDRKVFSGENIVFQTSVEGDRLLIKPMLIADLRRSIFVVNSDLGATTVIDSWGERVADELTSIKKSSTNNSELTFEDLSGSTSKLMSYLEREPVKSIQTVFSIWTEQLAQKDLERSERLNKARLIRDAKRASEIDSLVSELDAQPYEAWKKNIVIVINLLQSSKYATAETYLRAALSIAKRSVAVDPSALTTETVNAWSFLAKALMDSDEELDLGPGGKAFVAEHQVSPQSIIYSLIESAKNQDNVFVESALNKKNWPSQPSDKEKKLSYVRNIPQSKVDLEVYATEEIKNLLKQRSYILSVLRELSLDGEIDWNSVRKQLKRASELEGSDDVSFMLDYVVKSIQDLQFLPESDQTISKLEIANQLHSLSSEALIQADVLDHNFSNIRFSQDHDKLSARLAFEKGEYAEALRRNFSSSSPISLSFPGISWQILSGNFKGIPRKLDVRKESNSVVVRALKKDSWADVLKLEGLDSMSVEPLTKELIAIEPKPPFWSDGEMVADQVLTSPVNSRPKLADAAKNILGKELWLFTLKAMVYGCVPPSYDLIPISGRCSATNTGDDSISKIHDRINAKESKFRELSREELFNVADDRFDLNNPSIFHKLKMAINHGITSYE